MNWFHTESTTAIALPYGWGMKLWRQFCNVHVVFATTAAAALGKIFKPFVVAAMKKLLQPKIGREKKVFRSKTNCINSAISDKHARLVGVFLSSLLFSLSWHNKSFQFPPSCSHFSLAFARINDRKISQEREKKKIEKSFPSGSVDCVNRQQHFPVHCCCSHRTRIMEVKIAIDFVLHEEVVTNMPMMMMMVYGKFN